MGSEMCIRDREMVLLLHNYFLFRRHMVATRDIKAGELIFTETPLSVGPRWNTRPVCLGCYNTRITRDTPACKRCGFPVCSERCSEAPEHRDFECSALFNNNYKVGK